MSYDTPDLEPDAAAVQETGDPLANLQRIVKHEIDEAADFIDGTIGPDRAKLLAYDRGDPFGDEMAGRSQIVSRDCHDTRVGLLPSVQRVFFGAERVMEFEPGGKDDQKLAEQQTDHVHHVIMRENEGYEILSDAFTDAIRQRAGFVKAWWSETKTKKRKAYTGLDEAALAVVIAQHEDDPEADIEDEKVTMVDGVETFDVTVCWMETTRRIRIAAVPPEELIINRSARCIESARLVAHRRVVTKSELVAMGIDRALIEAHATGDMDANQERLARNPTIDDDDGGEGAESEVLYVEAWIRVDHDGDGIAELRRICTLGDDYKIISNDYLDRRPIADFRTAREPHTFFAESVEEKVMDVQRIKSMTMRAVMDSLALATNPRMQYDPAKISFEEAANGEIGALLAVRNLGAGAGVVPLETPFSGAAAFPVLEYLDQMKENRVGVSKAAAGLDANAMQGSSTMAVAGTYSRADAQAETIARDFAEGGMKRLYQLVLYLTVEHQEKVKVQERSGDWIEVPTDDWKLDLNLAANVVVGVMSDEEKLATLEKVAAEQKLIIQTLGADNPFCNLTHLYATYAKMLAIRGWKDPSAFFADPSTAPEGAFAPAAPPETPEAAMARASIEVERMKAERTLLIEEQKLKLEERKMQLADDRERDKLAMDHQAKLAALEAEFGFKREQAQMQAMIESTRAVNAGAPGQASGGA